MTQLNLPDETVNRAAVDLVCGSKKHWGSAEHPGPVHERYRAVVRGEHLVVRPSQVIAPRFKGAAIVIGFRRSSETSACKLGGVFTVEADGQVREHTEFKAGEPTHLEQALQRHFVKRIKDIKAAQERASQQR